MRRRNRRSGEWCHRVQRGERSSGRHSEWKQKNPSLCWRKWGRRKRRREATR
ncbi:hypothetical protein E2C01_100746 [Portunus trituberculatus]|uniref:Uncharacterized protein n=1 Tax=Portunus trituberculatus TaxID=210409 RepID=A0A5B7KDT5_PORTR|nr:hypothetical protein [Portunus trituberculatus]